FILRFTFYILYYFSLFSHIPAPAARKLQVPEYKISSLKERSRQKQEAGLPPNKGILCLLRKPISPSLLYSCLPFLSKAVFCLTAEAGPLSDNKSQKERQS